MYEPYQDSMVIVREYGNPDGFVTKTWNPRWDEIVEQDSGRPDRSRPT